jgi:hypothetical protein
MTSDIHARIQAFLQQQTIVPLAPESAGASDESYIKAGVVPFLRQEPYLFYLMKPVPRHLKLGAPAFQLCKGTRMQFLGEGGWRDMRDDAAPVGRMETLAATALREGIEELGLKLEAITRILDVGPYRFSSAKSGVTRQMWLFAAEMSSSDALPMEEVAKTTTERGWLSCEQFAVVGREDHRYIVRDIAARLKVYYKE